MIDRRRLDANAHAARFLSEAVELVGVADVEGHRGRQELDRVIGLEIRRLIGDQRIGRGVRFVEAVAGEFGHELEDELGAAAIDALADGALDEAVSLLRHLLLDLLAHGAAEQIGLAEREAGEDLRDLHHLLLVDDHAIGLFQDRLDRGMQIVRLLAAVLAVDVAVDVVHRPRPIERDDGDDVLEAVGLQLAQGVAHARTFELEHADRIAARQERVGRGVVEREPGGIERRCPCGRSSSRAVSITVSVFRPRKSNFTRPAASAHFMLNWVAGSWARGSR